MDAVASTLALRESEELHRITLLNMSDAVFITTDDGAFTYVCPNVDVIFGYDPDEVWRMSRIAALLGGDLIDYAQLQTNGEIRNIEHEIVTKHGTRRVVLVHVKLVAIRGGTALWVCRDITERKESEEVLRRDGERLTLALEAASMGTWDWDVATGEMTWSPETRRILGDPDGTSVPSFDAFLDRVHRADRQRVAGTMRGAMERAGSYETEFRVVGFDRLERWIMGKGNALRNGKPLRMLGVFVDFTGRHRLEDELRSLSGQLIHAHEEERSRIARELHDDVAQRFSLLAVDLATLARDEGVSPILRQRVSDLSERTTALAADLHRMSHQLHPVILEQLGLEAAIRAYCEELSTTRQFTIDLDMRDLPATLSWNLALCVFRIAQEALHNAVRHSGAAGASVTIAVSGDEIVLRVIDHGSGFDPEAPRHRASLGLSSMRERARMAKGRLEVHSRPGAGTRVEAHVPLQHA